MPDKLEETSCFTYEVNMVIQILAEDEESARDQLDKNGGYVTARHVKLMDSIALYNGVK
jgi:hypothetical protein